MRKKNKMHDEPQVSSRGEWGDVAIVEDNKGRFDYYCKWCIIKSKRFHSRNLERMKLHVVECKKDILLLEEGIDYMACKICNTHCQSLGKHISFNHDISHKEYIELYGELICHNSTQKYSLISKDRVSWRIAAKENGVDLVEFDRKLGQSISKSILENPKEIERRSLLMSELHKTTLNSLEIRKLWSDAAKITSARPEIIRQRTENLKNWRENNPEEFKIKCLDKLLAAPKTPTWFSKPEKLLYQYLLSLSDFNFLFNQVVISDNFDWKSKRKQVDMADKMNNIYVEYDGPFHFKPLKGKEGLEQTKKRDYLLDQYIIENSYILIRISYDQFIDKRSKGGFFKEECLLELNRILELRKPGVFKIGSYYEQSKEHKICGNGTDL